MPPKINPFWEGYINALSEEKYSYSQIKKRCFSKGFSISIKGIYNVINSKGKSRSNIQNKKTEYPKPIRTKKLI